MKTNLYKVTILMKNHDIELECRHRIIYVTADSMIKAVNKIELVDDEEELSTVKCISEECYT